MSSKNSEKEKELQKIRDEISQRFRLFMVKMDLIGDDFEQFEMSNSTVSDWCNSRAPKQIVWLYKIAKEFDVSLDDLIVGRNRYQTNVVRGIKIADVDNDDTFDEIIENLRNDFELRKIVENMIETKKQVEKYMGKK